MSNFHPILSLKNVLSRSFVILIPALFAGMSIARAHVDFDHAFAPSESWVKAPEKLLRDDISLNGSWQFQSVSLPANLRKGLIRHLN